MTQGQPRLAWPIFILLSAIILGGAWAYTNWQSSRVMLPPGLTINGLPMGGMTREQALNAIALAYTRPITVYYGNKLTPLLLPEMVELSLDMAATEENLDEALATRTGTQEFLHYLLRQIRRDEPEAQEVVAVVSYSRERVDAFLARIAQKYDHPPQNAVLLPEAGTFRPPQDGTTLDVQASLPLLIKAILSAKPQDREVHLVVKVEPAPQAAIFVLHQALEAALREFNGVAGIFAKDLQHGEEFCYNCRVVFSGVGALKIAIATGLYAALDTPPQAGMSAVNALFAENDDTTANLLLTQLGAGDAYSGALQVTNLLWGLGLRNTFIAAPYGVASAAIPPDIAAIASADSQTHPSPLLQTTPLETGLLLEGLYHCSKGGGFLRAVYPQKITVAECQAVLTSLENNPGNALLSVGMPAGLRMAHEHGWSGKTHADIALVYGSQTDLLLVVYLYQPTWLVWSESTPTFATIGQLVYRFFNGEE